MGTENDGYIGTRSPRSRQLTAAIAPKYVALDGRDLCPKSTAMCSLVGLQHAVYFHGCVPMSGAAHSLVWHYFGNEGTKATDLDACGVGQINVAGDVGRLVMDYFSAYHVVTAGWRLLAKRCGPAI